MARFAAPPTANGDFDVVSGPKCIISLDMLELMSQRLHTEPEKEVKDSNAPAGYSIFVAPNYVAPPPVLIKHNPHLAEEQYKKPPPSVEAVKLRLKDGPPQIPPIQAPLSSTEVPAPKNKAKRPAKTPTRKSTSLNAQRRAEREPDEFAVPPSKKPANHFSALKVRTRSAPKRPSLKERVSFLKSEKRDLSIIDEPNIRLIADEYTYEECKRLAKQLEEVGVKARVPKLNAVAANMEKSRITHVVVPRKDCSSLFVTFALACGAWRVSYDWLRAILALPRGSALPKETDFDLAYRSKHLIFKNCKFHIAIDAEMNWEAYERINAVLVLAGAIPENNISLAQIIVLDNDTPIPKDNPNLYWFFDDFTSLYFDAKHTPPKPCSLSALFATRLHPQ